MRISGRRPLPGLIALLLTIVASCDLGPLLLTDGELEAMYFFACNQADARIQDGSQVDLSLPLSVKLGRDAKAPVPAALELTLVDASGLESARLAFVPASRAAAAPSAYAVSVESLEGWLPPVLLPGNLTGGYYSLTITARSESGSRLAGISFIILIGAGPPPRLGLVSYPAAQGAGQTAMFKLAVQPAAGTQPWVRWSVDGAVLAYGRVSDRMDRFLWTAPEDAGVHLVRAEYFPFEPPAMADFPAHAQAEFKVPVAPFQPEDKASADAFLRLDPVNALRSGAADADGQPYPEALGSSFGLALGPDSGLRSAGNPLENLADGPMFLALDLSPMPEARLSFGSGTYLSLYAADGTPVMELGLTEGVPWLRSGAKLASAASPVPAKALALAITLTPGPDSLLVAWQAGELSLGSATLPWKRNAESAIVGFALGGKPGLAAVYGSLRTGRGVYPAWFLAMRSRYGKRLLAADGFENPALSPTLAIGGMYRLADGLLYLEPGSALSVGVLPAGNGQDFELWWSLRRGLAELSLPLADGRRLSLSSAGVVRLGAAVAGTLQLQLDAPVVFAWQDGTLTLSSGNRSIIVAAMPARLIGLALTAVGGDTLVLDSLALGGL